jgi:hypothetical protein
MPFEAILREVDQLHNVSTRLEGLAELHPPVSEALITIAEACATRPQYWQCWWRPEVPNRFECNGTFAQSTIRCESRSAPSSRVVALHQWFNLVIDFKSHRRAA